MLQMRLRDLTTGTAFPLPAAVVQAARHSRDAAEMQPRYSRDTAEKQPRYSLVEPEALPALAVGDSSATTRVLIRYQPAIGRV